MTVNQAPIFTVFTPTYNRAHTLPKVYESLVRQTCKDFEWLIVDDGSMDDTKQLVHHWQLEKRITIRYFKQENRGKHIATNRGVREARGQLFLILDSDDRCLPQTLEVFKRHWEAIPQRFRASYSTLSVLCLDSNHQVVGGKYPRDVVDAKSAHLQEKLRRSGERWGVNKTAVLKRYPFPEFQGEKFIPESIVWNRLSKRYWARFVNEPLRIYEPMDSGLSSSMLQVRAQNPKGSRLYYQELSALNLSLYATGRALINYIRFSFHAGVAPVQVVVDSPLRLATVLLLPVGFIFYQRDMRK